MMSCVHSPVLRVPSAVWHGGERLTSPSLGVKGSARGESTEEAGDESDGRGGGDECSK